MLPYAAAATVPASSIAWSRPGPSAGTCFLRPTPTAWSPRPSTRPCWSRLPCTGWARACLRRVWLVPEAFRGLVAHAWGEELGSQALTWGAMQSRDSGKYSVMVGCLHRKVHVWLPSGGEPGVPLLSGAPRPGPLPLLQAAAALQPGALGLLGLLWHACGLHMPVTAALCMACMAAGAISGIGAKSRHV